jgi:hypothetical protein
MCRPTFRCSKSVGLGSAMLNVSGSLRHTLLLCRWRWNILTKCWSLYELYGAYRRSRRFCCHRRENLQSAFLLHSVTGASCKFLPSLLIKDLQSISAGSNCDVLCQFRSAIISSDKPFSTFCWLACPITTGHSSDRPTACWAVEQWEVTSESCQIK